MLTAELTYTPVLIRRAAFAFVRRGLGMPAKAGLIAMIVSSMWLLASGSRNSNGAHAWLNGVWCGATGVLIALVVGLYFLHYRRGLARLRRMKTPHATIEVDDREFRAVADTGSYSTAWTTFNGIWRFRDFWLLVIGTNQYITLPVASLSDEIQAFIVARVKESGGRVS